MARESQDTHIVQDISADWIKDTLDTLSGEKKIQPANLIPALIWNKIPVQTYITLRNILSYGTYISRYLLSEFYVL